LEELEEEDNWRKVERNGWET